MTKGLTDPGCLILMESSIETISWKSGLQQELCSRERIFKVE